MGYQLVGTIGVVVTPGTSHNATPAWGVGENRTAGNLLLCWLTGKPVLKPICGSDDASWLDPRHLGRRRRLGAIVIALYYKIAAGGDAAPSFTSAGSVQQWMAQLGEFSGNTASPLDQAAISAVTTAASGWSPARARMLRL